MLSLSSQQPKELFQKASKYISMYKEYITYYWFVIHTKYSKNISQKQVCKPNWLSETVIRIFLLYKLYAAKNGSHKKIKQFSHSNEMQRSEPYIE